MLIQKQYKKNNFTGNLERPENTAIFFTLEKLKEYILNFSQGRARVL